VESLRHRRSEWIRLKQCCWLNLEWPRRIRLLVRLMRLPTMSRTPVKWLEVRLQQIHTVMVEVLAEIEIVL